MCATGIEKAEEWMWLESAGIAYFQGPFFLATQMTAYHL
ncbi:hypothetical protein VBQ37_08420 [Klebsiella pneumoniae]|nr:hypothetical protein [Klebsiella pneumoniae]